MAAEGLQKAAEKAGLCVKVETRGSGGAKNVLTESEIAEADCIIVAADTKVPMERFNGKKVIVTQVSDGISKADDLSQRHLAEMFRYLPQMKVMRVFRLSRIIKRESVTEFISTL